MSPEEKLFLLGFVILTGKSLSMAKLAVQEPNVSEGEAVLRGREEWQKAAKLGAKIVFFEDPEYPSILKEIKDPPAFLYVKGRLESEACYLAMVGTRKPTPYGRKVAFEWAKELASLGLGIVSGLALGIDTEAHRGALSAEGYTVAVLGSGLDWIYPYENRKLAEKIVARGGALISEFPFGSRPERWRFPRRNRIISGMSKGVLVVEAAQRSGSLITARLAADQGREVMAVPGSVFSEASQGTHYLIREGAYPVTSPKDVIEVLGVIREINEEKNDNVVGLSPSEEKLLGVLSVNPKHFDELIAETGLPVTELSELLLLLELKGLVQSLPGKFFQRMN
ncbi:DNA-processing protein DprA [Thermosulfurimonas dismutans]|uniref:Rossmann fold nucleotide-binding protein Smf n=1 Tax=Thermosulfurimonas dismutans TaxID=999894 RepID=A0A179D3W1_9BACT|nr:DNA-processing protein DprA [Thermosulfurimonas dismutans]OAQ20745.1 Rossmann fold nucleotide-binding protein Smf [Thermosulfurimonas dismutans]